CVIKRPLVQSVTPTDPFFRVTIETTNQPHLLKGVSLMLTRVFASLFALCLVFLATPLLASAQAAVANGNYKFVMEDGLSKYLEFDARSDDKGTTTGYMIFNDETPIIFQDVDGNGDKGDEPLPFTMKADLDSMTVEKNRALISGVIRDSNYPGY